MLPFPPPFSSFFFFFLLLLLLLLLFLFNLEGTDDISSYILLVFLLSSFLPFLDVYCSCRQLIIYPPPPTPHPHSPTHTCTHLRRQELPAAHSNPTLHGKAGILHNAAPPIVAFSVTMHAQEAQVLIDLLKAKVGGAEAAAPTPTQPTAAPFGGGGGGIFGGGLARPQQQRPPWQPPHRC